MEKDFKIRKATIRDLEDILNLRFAIFKREHKEYDKSLNTKWAYDPRGKKQFRKEIIRKDGFIKVIEVNNKLVGYFWGDIRKRMFYRKKAKYAAVETMFIEKKYRRKGLGNILLKDFLNWCKKNKVDYISASAYSKNKLALKFYKRAGFKDYTVTLEKKLSK